MVMKMKVLFRKYLVADYVQLVHHLDLGALLGRRRFGAVRVDGNVAQLPGLGNCHVIDSVKQLEAVHDPDEQMVRVLFEVERVQDALQGAVEADLSRLLNVPEILMVAMQDEDERSHNFMHSLSIADRWILARIAEQNVNHNLLDVLSTVKVYVRICSNDVLPDQVSKLSVAKMLIPDGVFRLRQWVVYFLRLLHHLGSEDVLLLNLAVVSALLRSLFNPRLG